MKRRNRTSLLRRTGTSFLLSGLLWTGGMLPAHAEQPRYSQAPASPAGERPSDDTILLGIGALAVAGLACAFLGCFGGGEDEEPRASGGERYRYNGGEADSSADDDEDTSLGCYWGDRAYDTCR